MFRKRLTYCLVWISLAIPVAAQSVKLTGTVLAVSAEGKTWQETKSKYVFSIRLYLQLRNSEDYPIILLKPGSFFLERKVELFDSYDGPPLDSFSVKFHSTNPGRGQFGGFTDREPSKELFVIIPPNGYYEFADIFVADSGYSTNEELVKDWAGKPLTTYDGRQVIRYSPAVPTRRYLQVEYRLSLKNEKNIVERLAAARERWSKFGKLLISPDGDFTLRSELIVNAVN